MPLAPTVEAPRRGVVVRLDVGASEAVEAQPYQLWRDRPDRLGRRPAMPAMVTTHPKEAIDVRLLQSPGGVRRRGGIVPERR